MHEKKAKIVSLVPSWTETLLEAGLNVVGRTRFCLHPAQKVQFIPSVGGTKNMKLREILNLKPDYVVLDKEENKKEMAEALTQNGVQLLVSEVRDLTSAADFLQKLGEEFSNMKLADDADIYRNILQTRHLLSKERFLKEILIHQSEEFDESNFEYVIWKDPYMTIGQNTFIAAVFDLVGLKLVHPEKYPKLSEEELKSRYCLFSTEPYPFERQFPELIRQGFRGALVDGEKVSWYGIRNIKFLQSCLQS